MIRVVAETGSTNADLLQLVRAGAAEEGLWLRAERQTAGRGRQGRQWDSPAGNFYGSTLVRLRAGDPAAATLGFVAAVALAEVVAEIIEPSASALDGGASRSLLERTAQQRGDRKGGLRLKWPNDLLLHGAKLSGILLERAGDDVVIGIGVNLAHHPDLPDRPTTSLAAHGAALDAAAFAPKLADAIARWIERWRADGFAPVRERWLELAHPIGSPLRAVLPDGDVVEGAFETLDAYGVLILHLADGTRRSIHAGDVFPV